MDISQTVTKNGNLKRESRGLVTHNGLIDGVYTEFVLFYILHYCPEYKANTAD
jgi:hypothetical protein